MVIFAHNQDGFVVHLEGQYLMRTTRSSCQFMSMVERLAPAHERIFDRHKELAHPALRKDLYQTSHGTTKKTSLTSEEDQYSPTRQ